MKTLVLPWYGFGSAGRASGIRRTHIRIAAVQKAEYVAFPAAKPKNGDMDEDTATLRRLLEEMPGEGDRWMILGCSLIRQQRFEEARDALVKATELSPSSAPAWNNLASALRRLGQIEEATKCCEKALAIDPEHAEAWFHLGDCRMLLGDFKGAYECYEWRKRIPEVEMPGANLEQPEWTDGNLDGRTVLVIAEQGFGDSIQYCRFVPQLKDQGANVYLVVQSRLKALFRSLDGVDLVIGSGEPLPVFELRIPLLSLPYLLGTDFDSLPATVPYLSPTREASARVGDRIGEPGGFKIGLVWQGAEGTAADLGRSFCLSDLGDLAAIPDCRFYSFQKGPPRAEIAGWPCGSEIMDLGGELASFDDTAAWLQNMDLIIASDTAVAHLAGALARPTWLALRYVPAARWLLGRPDSPWYPTLRLYRQPQLDDWASVFASIVTDARKLASTGGQTEPSTPH